MTTCVFPGSFDPVTKGHLNLIERAAAVFDHVSVVVMINVAKECRIPATDRKELLRKACGHITNVSIDSWNGLLADYMREKNEHTVVRGVRSAAELEYELNAMAVNRMLNDQIEYVFLPSDSCLTGVSSSAVREISAFAGDISAFVPDGMTEDISLLLSKMK